MKYIGIDGCKSGWFYISITENNWDAGILENISDINLIAGRNDIILVDIPIGLKEEGKERDCDKEARKLLKFPRSCSVFPSPVRSTLIASNYEKASIINFKKTGKKISKQTFNIMPKIKEVDSYMSKSNHLHLREMHPEVCFWSLNKCESMSFNKKTSGGQSERINLLKSLYKGSKDIIEQALLTFLRKDVAKDDVLDALVGAITAMNYKKFNTLPVLPSNDLKGLSMEIVYAKF